MRETLLPFARFISHRLREAALYKELLHRRSKRTVLVFQPHGRFGSSLLRGYEVAEGLRQRGWCAVVVPEQLETAQRARLLRRFRPDIVMQLKSRDPRNTPGLFDGYPYVYDLDDADFHSDKLRERMQADASGAAAVIAGSRYIAEWCRQHNPNTHIVWTGARAKLASAPDHRTRAPIIAWAQSAPNKYTAEFDFVVTVLEQLAQKRDDIRLRLYGDEAEDAGRSAHLRSLGVAVEWLPFLKSYDDFLASLCEASVGFSPICVQSDYSRGKSFGKILAYLDARVPCVVSDEADHQLFFTPEAGVVSNDIDTWVARTDALLSSAQMRNKMAEAAYALYLDQLSLDVVTAKVEAILLGCLEAK